MRECVQNIDDFEFYFEGCCIETTELGNIRILKVVNYYDDILSMLAKSKDNKFYFLSGAKELFETDISKYKRAYNMVEMSKTLFEDFIYNRQTTRTIFKYGNLYKIELHEEDKDDIKKINFEDLRELDLPSEKCLITNYCNFEDLKYVLNCEVIIENNKIND